MTGPHSTHSNLRNLYQRPNLGASKDPDTASPMDAQSSPLGHSPLSSSPLSSPRLGNVPPRIFPHHRAELSFCSLGSGSEGNSLLVSYLDTLIMVDCGFKISAIRERLARHQLRPEHLSAIVVTHEHGDHLGGVASLARAGNVPIFGSRGTLKSIKTKPSLRLHFCQDGQTKTIGALQINPFSVPHDANEPLQLLIQAGSARNARRLGVITDAGHVSTHMVDSLSGCHALYVEFNHDPLLLRHSAYPPRLRARIAGNYGHLSNQQAVKLLLALPMPKPEILIAAHLSKKTNSPDKVHEALGDYLSAHPSQFIIANQEDGFDWIKA